MEFLSQFFKFIVARRKFWLAPLLIALLIFGSLLVISQGSVISPFVYTLF